MKRIFLLLVLTVGLVLSLASCGPKDIEWNKVNYRDKSIEELTLMLEEFSFENKEDDFVSFNYVETYKEKDNGNFSFDYDNKINYDYVFQLNENKNNMNSSLDFTYDIKETYYDSDFPTDVTKNFQKGYIHSYMDDDYYYIDTYEKLETEKEISFVNEDKIKHYYNKHNPNFNLASIQKHAMYYVPPMIGSYTVSNYFEFDSFDSEYLATVYLEDLIHIEFFQSAEYFKINMKYEHVAFNDKPDINNQRLGFGETRFNSLIDFLFEKTLVFKNQQIEEVHYMFKTENLNTQYSFTYVDGLKAKPNIKKYKFVE